MLTQLVGAFLRALLQPGPSHLQLVPQDTGDLLLQRLAEAADAFGLALRLGAGGARGLQHVEHGLRGALHGCLQLRDLLRGNGKQLTTELLPFHIDAGEALRQVRDGLLVAARAVGQADDGCELEEEGRNDDKQRLWAAANGDGCKRGAQTQVAPDLPREEAYDDPREWQEGKRRRREHEVSLRQAKDDKVQRVQRIQNQGAERELLAAAAQT
mmetsp:Transcript_111418/g.345674  ORF Transcript_111418/g.345674 Transcript_111418/m.345674 type:complete len:213 (+) Transcript_111418:336-974(+)